MTVRTVLGDVDCRSLGATYVHEHLILDNPLIAADYPHIHLPSVDEAVAELQPCAEAGVGCMVDAMPAAVGDIPDRLADISQRTGVAIVAMTGLHTPKYYIHHPWAIEADPDVLAQLFAADIEDGIDRFDYTGPVVERTEYRAGVIKVATEVAEVSDRARRVFAGAAEAARQTGVPILTHTEAGVGAFGQLEVFRDLGFPLQRVVISHTDKITDAQYHVDLLRSGVMLEFDQALRQPPGAGNWTAELTARVVEERVRRAGHVRDRRGAADPLVGPGRRARPCVDAHGVCGCPHRSRRVIGSTCDDVRDEPATVPVHGGTPGMTISTVGVSKLRTGPDSVDLREFTV